MSSFSKNYQQELYESWVKMYANDMYRFAFRKSGSASVAEELVQEAFYEAWRSIDSLKEPDRSKAWLFQILQRRYIRWLQKHKRNQQHIDESVDETEQSASSTEPQIQKQLEERDLLQQGLENLEEHYKEPFLLVFLAGFSCQEVADELKIPLGTVLSRIHRARQYLRLFLQHTATEKPKEATDHNTRPNVVLQLSRTRQGTKP